MLRRIALASVISLMLIALSGCEKRIREASRPDAATAILAQLP